MAIIITSEEFILRAEEMLELSEKQPVFITEQGEIVSVLSSYQDYNQIHQDIFD